MRSLCSPSLRTQSRLAKEFWPLRRTSPGGCPDFCSLRPGPLTRPPWRRPPGDCEGLCLQQAWVWIPTGKKDISNESRPAKPRSLQGSEKDFTFFPFYYYFFKASSSAPTSLRWRRHQPSLQTELWRWKCAPVRKRLAGAFLRG